MKFELVEPPEAPDHEVRDEAPEAVPATAEEAIAGLTEATVRFSADVAAESERIDASLAELAQVIRDSGHARHGFTAVPPGNFRPDRFSPPEEKERGR
ncbi:hypothetical protein AGRA3207_005472 [Actinomadura graeca]|uniref:Uncharacterized protein n=1 Tax=Actinomadura graeca TaxID=2750812 RepID=A0ABX8QZP3_9ACTN|nr:hypothetical protein [Actinomadura graeca]QXJ24197.1 hypothetical protein AGRA3207_005472 [Actinomadura graeca]